MTSYGLDEWFWAMFEPTWTWPNFTFGQLFMWIGANNDQIWLWTVWTVRIMTRYDFLWARWVILSNVPNRIELDLISLLVNFSCELGQIMTKYNVLYKTCARWVMLSKCSNWLELYLISLLVNFSYELGQICLSYEKKVQSGARNLI